MKISIAFINIDNRHRKDLGDIDALAKSIHAIGLLHPVVINSNYQLIAGERRIEAHKLLGLKEIEARIVHVPSLLQAEHDENELCKSFTPSERVAIARAIEDEIGRQRGGDRKSEEFQKQNFAFDGKGVPEIAAERAGFGNKETYRQAKKVVDDAVPEIIEKMDKGEIAISTAATVSELPKAQQQDLIDRNDTKAILDAAKDIRISKSIARKEEIAAIKAANPVVIPDGKYSCIVIDPPWEMKKIERDVRPNQVEFDYPTMDEVELSEFDVSAMAADDCHLFCWTTHKHLPMALRLLDKWGFRYVCTLVWHKPGGFQPIGLPQYNCEFVLYARLGTPEFLDTKAFSCCFEAPRREHSRKPDEFYSLIARVTDQPRIDVFSRESRQGFDQFGNETRKFG